ncbi:MAG TPA: hypothetical protein VNN23_10795, partial [Ornithinibacter sp.]|nr:hypothetical protein [Ornithinibacter sp.]
MTATYMRSDTVTGCSYTTLLDSTESLRARSVQRRDAKRRRDTQRSYIDMPSPTDHCAPRS